ncbi:MAG: tRNA dihydrouridine synthase DusB [Deltaproteobacteria bacterium]|nr:MAG: tRNA dihydrouridine synthase DusB [Deltaproteobacteria bacterium]
MAMTPFESLFANRPVILAPMEDVTNASFRQLCRRLGAELCVTEFVNAEGLLRGCQKAKRKLTLAPADQPTAIQIYGSDPPRLAEAAMVAAEAQPCCIDINCGCWVPKVARRGAGAGWLRDPAAMVEMAALVVRSVSLPVTVKTRIGYGTETEMPIVDLARRLEDVGIQALTLHCRTAKMGYRQAADWSWAAKVQAVVSIPVIANGDIKSAEDAARAMAETGCPGVMIGRRAIEHPWVFREARALLDRGTQLEPPTLAERLALCREHLAQNVAERGEPFGVNHTRRHLGGYIRGLRGAAALRRELFTQTTLATCLATLDRFEARHAAD